MGDPTEIFIGIDVPKARNAIAVADVGRGGEVRFIGEVDASTDAMKRVLQRIAANTMWCIAATRQVRRDTDCIA